MLSNIYTTSWFKGKQITVSSSEALNAYWESNIPFFVVQNVGQFGSAVELDFIWTTPCCCSNTMG